MVLVDIWSSSSTELSKSGRPPDTRNVQSGALNWKSTERERGSRDGHGLFERKSAGLADQVAETVNFRFRCREARYESRHGFVRGDFSAKAPWRMPWIECRACLGQAFMR